MKCQMVLAKKNLAPRRTWHFQRALRLSIKQIATMLFCCLDENQESRLMLADRSRPLRRAGQRGTLPVGFCKEFRSVCSEALNLSDIG